MDNLWSFFKSQQVGSSTVPLDTPPLHDDHDGGDDDDGGYETANLGKDSNEQCLQVLTPFIYFGPFYYLLMLVWN